MKSVIILLVVYISSGLIEINAQVNILWDKTYGGFKDDYLTHSIIIPSGGYLLGGYSKSGVSGEKSDSCIGNKQTNDFWIINIDENGNKIWGNYSILLDI